MMMKKRKGNKIDNEGAKSGDEEVKMMMKKRKRDEMDNEGTKVVMRE
jgi:hypothetical protein